MHIPYMTEQGKQALIMHLWNLTDIVRGIEAAIALS